jgi:hypothetical protein
MYPMAALGLFLVVGGIVSETIFEVLDANVESQYRAHESDKITAAESEAAQATRQAGSAADSAKVAHQESNAATTASRNALNIASGARKEADSFERDIVSAKEKSADANRKAADAESHLAEALRQAVASQAEINRLKSPRYLLINDKLVSALKPYKGTPYTLNVFQDEEAIQFLKQIAAALDAAGWVRRQPKQLRINIATFTIPIGVGPSEQVEACIDTGVAIHVRVRNPSEIVGKPIGDSTPKNIKAALDLRDSIGPFITPSDTRNVASGIIDPDPEFFFDQSVIICVGKKP